LPGEFIGLSTNKTHTCNAEALSDASLCCFTIPNPGRIAKENPKMDGWLLAMTNTSLSLAQNHMLSLGRMNALEKTASFLCHLLKWASAANQPTDALPLPMSRTDIADYLGLTIETISRTL
jgi:CRP/FNR family transcriptional regulator